VLTICLVPVLIIAAFFYVTIGGALLLAATAAVKALRRPLSRWVFRFRTGGVRADGEPLTREEMRVLLAINRGWRQNAPEPEYDDWRRS
jgi:hypothetical protein